MTAAGLGRRRERKESSRPERERLRAGCSFPMHKDFPPFGRDGHIYDVKFGADQIGKMLAFRARIERGVGTGVRTESPKVLVFPIPGRIDAGFRSIGIAIVDRRSNPRKAASSLSAHSIPHPSSIRHFRTGSYHRAMRRLFSTFVSKPRRGWAPFSIHSPVAISNTQPCFGQVNFRPSTAR
uniref:Uncharacterized protein n=1 Tax=Candidatus Kentrum sp. LPFa TaxID=2126335 RepID=A0A450WB40_9GAMM|nr:MAG: hypothetical protein BECKLPF1236B_GA0070989_105811 [Candidatus Kentron sp. LPFa]